ncbi:MAG TPA: hypothetical protein VJ965_12310 [Anaerolineales bacterium]|nr:hypothetical protein [Anaerolineales bacterium]
MKSFHRLLLVIGLVPLLILASGCGYENVMPQDASAKPPSLLFEDNFDDPGSGWEVSTQGGVKDYYKGTYHIRIDEKNIFSWSVAQQSLGDVQIEVDLAYTGSAPSAEMGIICRMQNSHDFYMFTIRSDGYYAVFKMYQGNEYFLSADGYQFSDAIQTGVSTNHLTVLCAGERLVLSANGVMLTAVEDSSYAVGDVGVVAGAFNEPDVNVFFDNFSVSQP